MPLQPCVLQIALSENSPESSITPRGARPHYHYHYSDSTQHPLSHGRNSVRKQRAVCRHGGLSTGLLGAHAATPVERPEPLPGASITALEHRKRRSAAAAPWHLGPPLHPPADSAARWEHVWASRSKVVSGPNPLFAPAGHWPTA